MNKELQNEAADFLMSLDVVDLDRENRNTCNVLEYRIGELMDERASARKWSDEYFRLSKEMEECERALSAARREYFST